MSSSTMTSSLPTASSLLSLALPLTILASTNHLLTHSLTPLRLEYPNPKTQRVQRGAELYRAYGAPAPAQSGAWTWLKAWISGHLEVAGREGDERRAVMPMVNVDELSVQELEKVREVLQRAESATFWKLGRLAGVDVVAEGGGAGDEGGAGAGAGAAGEGSAAAADAPALAGNSGITATTTAPLLLQYRDENDDNIEAAGNKIKDEKPEKDDGTAPPPPSPTSTQIKARQAENPAQKLLYDILSLDEYERLQDLTLYLRYFTRLALSATETVFCLLFRRRIDHTLTTFILPRVYSLIGWGTGIGTRSSLDATATAMQDSSLMVPVWQITAGLSLWYAVRGGMLMYKVISPAWGTPMARVSWRYGVRMRRLMGIVDEEVEARRVREEKVG